MATISIFETNSTANGLLLGNDSMQTFYSTTMGEQNPSLTSILAQSSKSMLPGSMADVMMMGVGMEQSQLNNSFSYNGEIFFANNTRTDLINNYIVQIAFCLIYSTIFIIGVFGNVLVCYVVFRNRAMQTVTNLFITNLALSDILLCLLAVPITPLYTFLQRWVFGTLLCHLMSYAQGCSVYISSLTLTSIAIDRFFVIIYPFHPRMKLTTCIAIIISIWCFALLVTLPYGLFVKHLTMINDTGTMSSYCEENWPSEQNRKLFGSMTSTLQFVLPFLIICFCYIRVSIKLNDRARKKPGTKTSRREQIDRDRKRRTNRMLIAMVAVFGISWLPLNVVNILNDFHESTNNWRFYNFIFFISHSVAMSSTCYNPFLYAWLNENFRKEFKQVLPCFSQSRRNNNTNGTKWRSERTCNGNNETVQESLLPSSVMRPNMLQEIIPRGPTANEDDCCRRLPFRQHQMQTNSVDSMLLSEVVPPNTIYSSHQLLSNSVCSNNSGGVNGETIMLPSGVLETPFDGVMASLVQESKMPIVSPMII